MGFKGVNTLEGVLGVSVGNEWERVGGEGVGSSGGYMSKEVGAFIKGGAIFRSVKRVRELMKCELCFNELSQNPHLYSTNYPASEKVAF